MEYLLGSLFTLLLMAYFSRKAEKVAKQKPKRIFMSQSYIDKLVEIEVVETFSSALTKPQIKTQASQHMEKTNIRVMVIDNQAFWIVEQKLYVADVVNGEVDNNTTRTVDTMNMNDVELKKTEFIVQKLTEGKGNDSGYPRKP